MQPRIRNPLLSATLPASLTKLHVSKRGWINFESTGNPRLRFSDGHLEGYAYSANCGWINLGDGSFAVQTDTIAPGIDTDSDGMADAFEFLYLGGLGETRPRVVGQQQHGEIAGTPVGDAPLALLGLGAVALALSGRVIRECARYVGPKTR